MLVGVLLGYFWLPAVEGFPKAVLKEMLAGVASSLLMGSWWSLLAVPLAVTAGGLLWQTVNCSSCATQNHPDMRLTALIWLAGLAGAVVSTLVAKQWLRTITYLAAWRQGGLH